MLVTAYRISSPSVLSIRARLAALFPKSFSVSLSRLHYRCCCHLFRHGRHVSMVLFVEIGEFSERDLRTVDAAFRRN